MAKVTLRKKKLTNDRIRLYLDFYPAIINPETGKETRREFLSLYIIDKPTNKIDKDYNKETLENAKVICARRQISLQQEEYGFLSNNQKKQCFVQYFSGLAENKKSSNQDNWYSALYYIKDFTKGTLMFNDITEKKCREFRDFLLVTKNRRNGDLLLTNTALSYYSKFKAALRQAYKDGILTIDISSRIESIKPADTHREYLTLEELQMLSDTDCIGMPILKRVALFSALTGMRFSDIRNLSWDKIRFREPDQYTVSYRQQKTNATEVLPISKQAFDLLGDRKSEHVFIFNDLKYSAIIGKVIRKWVEDAGIKGKHITFHSFRHSFATLQLTLGTDIYTISKMLGHRELKTTQVYTKIFDEAKHEAANRIKLKF